MASTASIKDEAIRALEGSLASTVELNKSLEAKLSASENNLADARAESAKLALEAQELRAALAERDEQLAQLKVQLDQALLESKPLLSLASRTCPAVSARCLGSCLLDA